MNESKIKKTQPFADERLISACIFCSGAKASKEHIPSKIFLDEPHPKIHPTIKICEKCNQSFSSDEEYVACLIESACVGSTEPHLLRRKKIKHSLKHSPKLASRIQQAFFTSDARAFVSIEQERVKQTLLKIARGHAVYELDDPTIDDPISFSFLPLQSMTPGESKKFGIPPIPEIFPEVGSRAFISLIEDNNQNELLTNSWVELQRGRYRYLATVDTGIIIRMVFSEYLACEALWQ